MKRSGRKIMICHNLVQEADTGKALNEICTNFVVEVGKQLMAHRDRQLELQKEHEERIARMLWMKILIVCIFYIQAFPLFIAYCKACICPCTKMATILSMTANRIR